MRKTRIASFLVLLALSILASTATAQVTYTGSLSWTNDLESCLTANGVWANTGTSISWVVSQAVMGGPWTYQYTLDVGNQGDISHFILELSPGLTLDDLFDFNWPAEDLEVNTFSSAGPGASNPGLQCPIYGIKFDEATELTETFSFRSFIAPTWGDFYAKDGQAGGADNYVFNSTICDADPLDPPSDGSINCKILRPDTTPGPVIPEPSSLALAAIGALPIVGLRLRRRGQKE